MGIWCPLLLYAQHGVSFQYHYHHLELNQRLTSKAKSTQLIKMTDNFSYASSIAQTKKKIFANCTSEVEDLFKRIFEPNAKKRITFA